MNKTPTAHIEAKVNDIAKTVIMPGDPRRAEKMAKKFLEDVKLVNSVRNNYCFTGFYNGTKVSIMSSGMGTPSMGIYSYELFNFYNVENIIRVGTIGSLDKSFKIGDIIIGNEVITDTNYNSLYAKNKETKLFASKKLVQLAKKISQAENIKAKLGTIYTTDTFYSSEEKTKHIISLGAKGVEMEAAALYENANNSNKNALTICTISDEILTNKATTSFERENNFDKMFELALKMSTNL